MRPRRIVPGGTYLVTRRCSQRQFLLLPSKEVDHLLLFCLAVAAKRFGIHVHAYVFMGNRLHLVVTDPRGMLPEFCHWLFLHIARALNCHFDRAENFFDPNQPSYVLLAGADDVLAKVVYTLTNPVAAGLVKKGDHWPGVRSRADQYGEVIEVDKPRFFFVPGGIVPEKVELELTLPAGYRRWSRRRFVGRLSRLVEEREAQIRERLRAESRKFLGPRKIRQQSRFGTPTSPRGFGKLSPRVAAKDKWRRIELLAQLVAFVDEYRAALMAYRRAKRGVVFPGGTYLMRLRHRASCRRAPNVRVAPA